MKTRIPGLTFTALLLMSCGGHTVAPQALQKSQTITLMTFNVENLFDNVDDPNKNDQTYLPIEAKKSDEHIAECDKITVPTWRDQCLNWDWNDAILEKKLSAIAGAILAVNDGRGPDIVALQEVENIEIVERLRRDYLKDADYAPAILLEGHDVRGVDVAFLTRLPTVGDAILHPVPTEGIDPARYGDTRGILEATFELPDGSLLTAYAVHFPAPFHPTAMRQIAYRQLNELRATLPDDRYVVAAGDFNTSSSENRRTDLLGRLVRPYWTIAHETGCAGCKGTQYYAPDDSWSYLDMILWSPAKNRGADATWSIRAGSVEVANKGPLQINENGKPANFELPEGSGVSDHWPLIVDIELD